MGAQCEVAPSCSFWDVQQQAWSTDGCALASLNGRCRTSTHPSPRPPPHQSLHLPSATILSFPTLRSLPRLYPLTPLLSSLGGSLVCECDHLTDFGLFFAGVAFDPSSYSAEVSLIYPPYRSLHTIYVNSCR